MGKCFLTEKSIVRCLHPIPGVGYDDMNSPAVVVAYAGESPFGPLRPARARRKNVETGRIYGQIQLKRTGHMLEFDSICTLTRSREGAGRERDSTVQELRRSRLRRKRRNEFVICLSLAAALLLRLCCAHFQQSWLNTSRG